MKKSVKTLALACVAACCALNAQAKTEGNYIGINVVNYGVGDTTGGSTFVRNREIRDISLSYKYAFNYNNFIIAPELRYGVGLSSAAQEVYDVKLHLGYDLSDKLAVLANVGFNSNNTDFTRTHHNEREAIVYGIGMKYQLDERFNLEASIDIREKGIDIETTNFGISYNF